MANWLHKNLKGDETFTKILLSGWFDLFTAVTVSTPHLKIWWNYSYDRSEHKILEIGFGGLSPFVIERTRFS
jgi:hypothetical protein